MLPRGPRLGGGSGIPIEPNGLIGMGGSCGKCGKSGPKSEVNGEGIGSPGGGGANGAERNKIGR